MIENIKNVTANAVTLVKAKVALQTVNPVTERVKEFVMDKSVSIAYNWICSHNPLFVHTNLQKELRDLEKDRKILVAKKRCLSTVKSQSELSKLDKKIQSVDKSIKMKRDEIWAQRWQNLGRYANLVVPGSGLAVNVSGLCVKTASVFTHNLDAKMTKQYLKKFAIQAGQIALCAGTVYGLKLVKDNWS